MNDSLNVELVTRISLLGLGYLVVITIALHKLRPDYNPLSRYISEYAVGEYGMLAASSFVVFGLTILGIYWCLQLVLTIGVNTSIGLTLMAIWGVSKVIIGFFKVDLKGEQMSLHGTVHSIASGIGVAASVIGAIILSQSIAYVAQIIAVIALVLAVLLYIGFISDLALKYNHKVPEILFSFHKMTGFMERLLLGISVVWLIIVVNWIAKSL